MTIATKLPPTVDGRGRCGTNAGYLAHRARGERACQPCKDGAASAARRSRPLRPKRDGIQTYIDRDGGVHTHNHPGSKHNRPKGTRCDACAAIARDHSAKRLADPVKRAEANAASLAHSRTPKGRESARRASREWARRNPDMTKARNDHNTRLYYSRSDDEVAALWAVRYAETGGRRACIDCGEVFGCEGFGKDAKSDSRKLRCNAVHGNGCQSRHEMLKRWAKLAPLWQTCGLDPDTCAYCLRPIGPGDRDVDHFRPTALGGADGPHNLVPSCPDCNRGQGGKFHRDPFEWLAATHPDRLAFFEALFPLEAS